MVAEQRALVPVDDADDEGPAIEPYVTVVFNGVPMRFRAGGLRTALANALLGIQQNLQDGKHDPKTRAMMGLLKQIAGLALPMLRGLVKVVRDDPRTPPAIRRSLPPVPNVPPHADRVVFLMTWLAEVAHAALTENAYVLDVVDADPASPESDVMRVARFGAADPYEELSEGDMRHE